VGVLLPLGSKDSKYVRGVGVRVGAVGIELGEEVGGGCPCYLKGI